MVVTAVGIRTLTMLVSRRIGSREAHAGLTIIRNIALGLRVDPVEADEE